MRLVSYQIEGNRSDLVSDHLFELFESELVLHSVKNL
jgi:hypothetical protein